MRKTAAECRRCERDSARREGRGEHKGSQEKGEVADLELPRSSGRLHPASSCARREKSAVRCVRSRPLARSSAPSPPSLLLPVPPSISLSLPFWTWVSRNPLNSYVTRGARRARRTPGFDPAAGNAGRQRQRHRREKFEKTNSFRAAVCYSHDPEVLT